MQNFGVYDLRIVSPGKFVLEGGDQQGADDDDDDAADAAADGANSRGGVNSGAELGPDGLGVDLPPALQPTLVARAAAGDGDAENTAGDDAGAENTAVRRHAPLCEEAYRFSCAADWLLADAKRCDTTLEALDDCTFVMATTARPRGNMPLVTARVAAEMLAKARWPGGGRMGGEGQGAQREWFRDAKKKCDANLKSKRVPPFPSARAWHAALMTNV